jgi:hypothetical protein
LEANLCELTGDATGAGNEVAVARLGGLFRQEGIVNRTYLSRSAFWIVHHDAIDTVYDLAIGFWHKAKEEGLITDVSAALGYAMQILCADPEAHRLEVHPDLWASDEAGRFHEHLPGAEAWEWRHPLRSESAMVRPAILHLKKGKAILAKHQNHAQVIAPPPHRHTD